MLEVQSFTYEYPDKTDRGSSFANFVCPAVFPATTS